ncbi:hypothetical protein [Aquiflexum sp.]|uniref:hypothetical protein n=1 Tax=Aquiflexum sp. TaxID=1872584 RepID=UPI0035936580
MSDTKTATLPENFSNPFLGPERDKLWERLYKNAKHVFKADLLKRAKDLKGKNRP